VNYADRTPTLVARLLAAQPQPIARRPLVPGSQGTGQGCESRPVVRIVRCARFLLDPDNLHASVKFLVDRLCEAGLIAGDTETDIQLEVSQIEVTQTKEIGTSGRELFTLEQVPDASDGCRTQVRSNRTASSLATPSSDRSRSSRHSQARHARWPNAPP
jgi:hypothetical protein